MVDVHDRADSGAAVDSGSRFTPPTRIVALGTWVPIRRDPRRDAPLVGYMRGGGITAVVGMPTGRESCAVHRDHPEGGWYQTAAGGYVCVGGSLAIPWPARSVRRPTQAALDAGMPYDYAIVYGTPIMYRDPPSEDTLRVTEPWRFHHDEDASAAVGPSEPADAGQPNAVRAVDTPGASDAHRGLGGHDHDHDHDHGSATPVATAPSATSAETPNGEPTLRDLRGDRGGPVIRRLISGMYVSLDHTVRSRATGDRYWRTQSGGFVREGALSVRQSAPTFTGAVLDGTQSRLPYAFMVSLHGWTYRLTSNERGASLHRRMPRLTGIQLSSDTPVELGGRSFFRTADGLAVDARNVRVATLRPPPDGVAATEKWLDVDLDQQILVAYEGARPAYVTLVSTGRRSNDELERYETPAGSFRIRGKHIATTMDGDTASDGPYSIEDVPWAQYFFENYALHGAFWHNNFGWRQSHGCVNLSPPDARWLFFWTDPQLPDGWHAVFATPAHPGSRVELHHGRQPTPRRPTI